MRSHWLTIPSASSRRTAILCTCRRHCVSGDACCCRYRVAWSRTPRHASSGRSSAAATRVRDHGNYAPRSIWQHCGRREDNGHMPTPCLSRYSPRLTKAWKPPICEPPDICWRRRVTAALRYRSCLTLHLRPVHDPAALRIKRVPPVHGAAVVPQHEVADAPHVVPRELVTRGKLPDFIEQSFRLRQPEPFEVCVPPPSKVQALPSRFGMCTHDRVIGPRRFSGIVRRRHALPDVSATVVGTVVLHT